MSDVRPARRRMSPEAAQVALVLIGSWALVALVAGALELWSASWNRSVLAGPGHHELWLSPPLGLSLLVLILWVYAYPAVLAGAVVGSIYLVRVHRDWRRAAAFAGVSLGGMVAASVLYFGGPNHSDQGDGADIVWPLAMLAVPVLVVVALWVLLGREVWAERRARAGLGAVG